VDIWVPPPPPPPPPFKVASSMDAYGNLAVSFNQEVKIPEWVKSLVRNRRLQSISDLQDIV